MCEPVTAALAAMSTKTLMAASLGVSALTAGAGYVAQSKQAEASEVYAENAQNSAIESMLAQGRDLNSREDQERKATALRRLDAQKKSKAAAATANATSESAGLSVDALMDDYERQYLNYSDSQMQQLGFQIDQIDRTREGLQAQAEGRVNQAQSQIKAKPSLAMTLGNFAATGLNTYQDFAVRDPFTGEFTI
ncbi:hypothetical protein MHM88_11295 [Epibacterium sp. MM17-32]|uniref:virion core protein, T7 gp14 family n=1 Tax=Epibacterium sp. MM17-32 TaxID=2917734 RepID=UPI001EF60489|nr:hypothetical protein [Epibacterium sp. MM17-32]MCG7628393.1 hypothetical protein [Epibacterium sp. MM17-32]